MTTTKEKLAILLVIGIYSLSDFIVDTLLTLIGA